MTDSVVLASGGSHTRTTPGESGSIASISPGPWCEKPLWSLRQHVEVSSTFSDGTDARHGSSWACCSHFTCCTAIEAETIANASYVANTPCRPVSVYPSSQPWHRCSLSTSITRPSALRWSSVASTGPMNARSVTSNTACSRLLAVSSGENSRNVSVAAYRSRISSPDDTVLPTSDRPRPSNATSYGARSTGGSASRSPPFAYGVADIRLSPAGARALSSGTSRPDSSNSVSGEYDRSHSSSIRRCSGFSVRPDSGTWCARKVPCTWTPSTTSGPVQPFGVRRMIAGHPASTSRDPRSPAAVRVAQRAVQRREHLARVVTRRRRRGPSPGCAGTPRRPRPRYARGPWDRRSCSR